LNDIPRAIMLSGAPIHVTGFSTGAATRTNTSDPHADVATDETKSLKSER
jgi:hypothetical protein